MNGKISEFVKKSKALSKIKSFATAKVISKAHKGLDQFCGSDECMAQVTQLQSTISSCYASVTCDFMGKVVPFKTCKAAMEKYMLSTMNVSTGSMCDSEIVDGKAYYCGELNADLMYKDFDCSMERMSAAQKHGAAQKPGECTPKCMQEWQVAKVKVPKCSNIVSSMTQQIYDNVKTLLKDIAADAKIDVKKILDNMPAHLPTYEEHCNKKELQLSYSEDKCAEMRNPCDPKKDRCSWSEKKGWHCLPKDQCPDCCYCALGGGGCGCAHIDDEAKDKCMWNSVQDWHCEPKNSFNSVLV